MSELQNKLAQLGACEKAVAWIGDKAAQEAWDACENPLWMLWALDAAHCPWTPSLLLEGASCDEIRAVLACPTL